MHQRTPYYVSGMRSPWQWHAKRSWLDVPAAALKRAWPHGWATIEPYDAERGAAHYIAKYVSKDFRDYDIGDRLPRRLT